jgi:hypothetical protein
MARSDLGLGRLKSADRDEDEKYLMRRALPPDRPPAPAINSWDLPAKQLRFQGATGTCVEHGGVHFLKCAPMKTRSEAKLPPQFSLYRKIVLVDEWPSNDGESTAPVSGLQSGTSVRALMKVLVSEGYVEGYAWEFTYSPASEWVRRNGPVIVGTSWYESMFNLTREGFAKITPTTTLAGGHCYLWVGSNTKRGIDLWANSWEHWGVDRKAFTSKAGTVTLANSTQRGFFLTSAEDTERLIHEDGEVTTATEKRWKPKVVTLPLPQAA